jgi:hypothetical protein
MMKVMVLRRSKPLALACSLTLVGGLLLAQWHRATETHSYCAEHGELTHGHGHEDHDHGYSVDHGAIRGEDRDRGHDQHGCAALDFLSFGSGVVAAASSLAIALPSTKPPAPVTQQLAFAGDRYRLCPKTSPPRA